MFRGLRASRVGGFSIWNISFFIFGFRVVGVTKPYILNMIV